MAYKNFKKAEIIDEIGSELRKARNAKELTLAQVADNLEQMERMYLALCLEELKTVSVVLMILYSTHFANYIILIRTILQ